MCPIFSPIRSVRVHYTPSDNNAATAASYHPSSQLQLRQHGRHHCSSGGHSPDRHHPPYRVPDKISKEEALHRTVGGQQRRRNGRNRGQWLHRGDSRRGATKAGPVGDLSQRHQAGRTARKGSVWPSGPWCALHSDEVRTDWDYGGSQNAFRWGNNVVLIEFGGPPWCNGC